ncbi:MAG: hypothetical protein ACPGED_06505, partial [Flavobacteriales bacterium]
MDTLPKALEELKGEERELIFSAPVWISLFAAYRHDGEIDSSEKSEAIKQAHFRTFTSPNALHAYYEAVDDHFKDKFELFNASLPEGDDQRDEFLEAKIRAIVESVNNLSDTGLASTLMADLNEFYKKVFHADSSVFQFFAIPLITKSLRDDDEDLEEI